MLKANKILLCLCLVFISIGLAWGEEPPAVFLVKSTSTFADIDKNGVIDAQENKAFESEKLKIFDLDHDGKLNDAEKARFAYLDKIISSGGQSLEELNEQYRQLYKQWRTAILLFIQKSKDSAALAQEKKPKVNNITKCYPDKVCDDPTSPDYGSAASGAATVPGAGNVNIAGPVN